MATTRKDLRQQMAGPGFANDGFLSTASATGGAAGATLVDTKRTEADDSFNNAQIVILTGTAAGDRRTVGAWVQSTGTYTPNANFTAQILAAVQYELHRVFSADEKDAAINLAIKVAAARWPRLQEDESITLLANTYTYALASVSVPIDPDFGLDSVEYDTGLTGTGFPFKEIDDDFWALRNDNGVLTLQLTYIPPNLGKVRLHYRVRPSVLALDSDPIIPATQAFQNYVVAKATAYIFDDAAQTAEMGQRDFWQVQGTKMHTMAEAFMNTDKPQPRPGKVRLWTWGSDSE